MRRLLLVFSTILALTTAVLPTQAEEAPELYRLSAVAAVSVLPEPLQAFFHAHLEAVQQEATGGIDSAAAPARRAGQPDWHYVMLDVAAGAGDVAKRRAAALAFPRDRDQAKALFQKVDRRDGGRLPWMIAEQADVLAESYRKGESPAIVRHAALLLHLATDAAMPFNTTVDQQGDDLGGPSWPLRASEPRAWRVHRSTRTRCQFELVRRLQDRLAFEVRIAPVRYVSVVDPTEAAFETLLDAHDRLQRFARIDREITQRLSVVDATTFQAAEAVYYRGMADRLGSDLESCIEAGGLLAARLIGHAWDKAGRPALPTDGGTAQTDGSRTRVPSAGETRLVGSRGSNVVHHATCSHAKRIKPENRVFFNDFAEAHQIGRVPCKLCRPGND